MGERKYNKRFKQPEIPPSEMDWLRLAAFIDGEGSILMTERHYKNKSWDSMYIRVVLCNTDPRMPKWCRDTFGGVFVLGDKRRKPNHRQSYKWHVSTRHAEWVIRGCLPYFLIKREQAEVALAFQETVRKSRLGQPVTVPDEVKEKRREFKAQLHELRWQTYEVPYVELGHDPNKLPN